MGSLPVLKSSEVCRILERLGFVNVRQRGSHVHLAMLMDAAQPFQCTKGVTSRRHCSTRSLATSD